MDKEMKRPGKLDNTDYGAWQTYSEDLEQQIKELKGIIETGHQVLLDLGFSDEELEQALKK